MSSSRSGNATATAGGGDPDTHKLNLGDVRVAEHKAIGSWLVTEKIDGTNIRVLLRLDGFQQYVAGTSEVTTDPFQTWWRDWATVEAASGATGIPTAPRLLVDAPLEAVRSLVEIKPASLVAYLDQVTEQGAEYDGQQYDHEDDMLPTMEGVVARTDPYLYDWQGHRIMFKLKVEDIPT